MNLNSKQIVADFAKRMETFEHRTENCDWNGQSNGVAGESIVRQHRKVVSGVNLVVKKMTRSELRTEWWKLKKEECHVAFREDVEQGLGDHQLDQR